MLISIILLFIKLIYFQNKLTKKVDIKCNKREDLILRELFLILSKKSDIINL